MLSSPPSVLETRDSVWLRLIFFGLANKHTAAHSLSPLVVGRTIPSVAVEFGSILTAQPAVLHAGEGANTALTL